MCFYYVPALESIFILNHNTLKNVKQFKKRKEKKKNFHNIFIFFKKNFHNLQQIYGFGTNISFHGSYYFPDEMSEFILRKTNLVQICGIFI